MEKKPHNIEAIMSKKIIIKTTLRTLIYQTICIFAVIVTIFLQNPVYWGLKAPIIEKSVDHIFYPIRYSPKVEEFVKKIGRTRLFFEICTLNGEIPELFEIVEGSEFVNNEEWYNCEYQYVDKQGILDVYDYCTRIDWKPWEFDYLTEEEYYDYQIRRAD